MSQTAQGPGAEQAPAGQQLSFEESLRKLETIVEAMEGSDLPLETLLARFEEGARLAELCQSRLAEAELKIQQLEKTAAGQLIMKQASLPEEPARS